VVEEKAMQGDVMRVAVIGRTGRGDWGHAIDELWQDLDVAEVVAAADENEAGLAAAAERHGLADGATFRDWQAMLTAVKPAIVAICPRNLDCHAEMAIAAAEAGAKGIFMEKPFVRTPAEADAVFYNTCSVRQHAEDKIYSALGRVRFEKQKKPGLVVGVLGCMAQKDQELIRKRAPWVDLVVGPGQLHQVPTLVADVVAGGGPRLEVSLDRKGAARDLIARSFESYDPDRDPAMRPTPFQAFIRTQTGCDKFCAFCVVPHVRGPEQARDPDTILAEARKLVAEGCREITLIGQTVNSYKFASGGKTTRLADLLVRLDAVEGLDRIKFVTNYPRDMTDDLIAAVRDLPTVSHYLHVPAQHGSDDVQIGRAHV